ncbi:hypothetical protein DEH69_06050 [Streptomyces sp. PT12]|nr:hypothetical protein DEH69_06050 [Streptomyces sp. PT12]
MWVCASCGSRPAFSKAWTGSRRRGDCRVSPGSRSTFPSAAMFRRPPAGSPDMASSPPSPTRHRSWRPCSARPWTPCVRWWSPRPRRRRSTLLPDLFPALVPPGTPAPRTDLLLPFHGVLAQPLGRASYYVLERRDAAGDIQQRGVIGALSLDGVETGHVLRRQQVGESDVRVQARLLRQRGGVIEPLLLAAPDLTPFQRCIDETTRGPADQELATPEGGVQRLWACDASWSADPPALAPVLLADGHHRLEAARRLHRAHPGAVADRLLALVVDHRRYPLTLSATHRVLPGLDIDRAVRAAARIARVHAHPPGAQRVPRPGTFLLTGGGQTWGLSEISPAAMAGRLRSVPAEWVELPAAISDHVLIPALCEDQGIEPAPRYTSSVPGPGEVGLILPPPTWDQIWAGAASGAGMPAKSTSFGPVPVAEGSWQR